MTSREAAAALERIEGRSRTGSPSLNGLLAALLSRGFTGAEAATVVGGGVFCAIVAFVALTPRRKARRQLRSRDRMS